MPFLLLFLLAFVASCALTGVVRLVAPRLGLLDLPRQDRWHRRPVPRVGGLAIYLTVAGSLLSLQRGAASHEARVLLIGGTVAFLVGFLDDIVRLENRPKLILLILCALVPALLGVRFELLPPLVGTPLAILWILGVTNAFNWLDNMDGVAAGIAAIASANLFALSVLRGGGEAGQEALVVAGAALGFLVHNFPPARVFMGDGGSGFLGFTLATLAVVGPYRNVSNVLLTVLVPALILSVPLFDTAMVTVTRILSRRPLFQGGRDHPAHRLVVMGLPERRAVLFLYGIGALAGSIALAISSMEFLAGFSLSVVLALAFVALGLVLAEVRPYEEGMSRNEVTLLPGPLMNKRWILLTVLDIVLIMVAYISAHLLRFEGRIPTEVASEVARTLPLVLGAKMVGLYLFGAYRGVWRYVGLLDAVRLAEGVTAGSVVGVAGLFLWARADGFWFSRAALVLDWILLLFLVVGSRLFLRLVREYLLSQAANGPRVLIVGAGEEAVLLLRAIRENHGPRYRPVGFVDDDPSKRGMIIQGLSVLGTLRELGELIRKHRVEEVLFADPSCAPEVFAEVADACQAAGVRMRRLGWVLE